MRTTSSLGAEVSSILTLLLW